MKKSYKNSVSSTSNDVHWKDNLNQIQTYGVPYPYRGNLAEYKKIFEYALSNEDAMFPSYSSKWNTVPYVKQNFDVNPGQNTPNYSQTNQEKLHEETWKPEKVIDKLLSHIFDTMNNPMHPNTQFNVLPHTTILATVSSVIGMKLNPNIINSHYSYNVAKAELELFSFLAHLLPLGTVNSPPSSGFWTPPWAPRDPDQEIIAVDNVPRASIGSGGISTFGGTGCYLYSIKYALTKVADSDPQNLGSDGAGSRYNGFPQGKFVIMTSNQGHYCESNVSDWTGIGANNVIKIKTNEDNTMSLEDLRQNMNKMKAEGKVVVVIVATVGTTDATAIDDVKGIREIVNDFENIAPYRKPYVYCDSVAGWSWIFFANYDYEKNPEGYNKELLEKIKINADRVQNISYSDMFGVDFHKTGYCHYPSSMVMFRDYGDFTTTMKRPSPPYLQQEQYDVGLYSLETSRGCIGTVGPWATLNYLGQSGMRAVLYNLVHNQQLFRKKLQQTKFIAVSNNNMVSYATLFRIYPFEIEDAQKYFEQELKNPNLKWHYMAVNAYQKLFYNTLFEKLRKPIKDGEKEPDPIYLKVPNLGLSTGYREVYYDMGETVIEEFKDVHVIKSYTKTAFTNEQTMDDVISVIKQIRLDIFNKMQKMWKDMVYKTQDNVIAGNIPEGICKQNNLIPPKFIPARFFKAPEF